MRITNQRINRVIREELDRARRMNEMTDQHYNDYLQSQHGRFTSPEVVMGTPQHRAAHGPYNSDRRGASSTPMGPASAEELERIRAGRGDSLADLPLNPYDGPNSPDSAYYGLREGDDDMEMEMEMDDDMGDDMDDDMGGDEVDEDELIDLSLFDDVDSDAAGAAFVEAVSQLRSENSDMQVTSAEIVARMRALLTPEDGDGPMDTGTMSESRWSRLAGILKG